MDAAVAAAKNDDAGEGLWALPEGWCWTALGEIVDIHDHRRRPIKSEDRQTLIAGKPSTELFPYYGATGQVGLIDGFLFDFPAILLGEDGAPFLDRQRAKAYAVDGRYWVNNHAHILTPRKSTIGLWLLHALNFIDYEPHVGGTTRLKLTKADLQRIPVPIAPLAEQRRIVARVDALFADIAEGEAALTAARKGLDTFRRALLKAAVTGELTKDWRAANPASKTGRDLLACITKEREKQGGRTRRVANSVTLDTSILPQLPGGWDWATLGGIAESVRNGTSAAPRAASNQHEILRISAVRPLRIDEAQVRFLDDDQAQAAAAATVETGDLLFTRYNGSADLVGVGAIYRGPKRFYPDKIIRVRIEPVLSMLAEFFELAVNTGAGRKHIAANIKTTAGQQGLSGESLKATPIPIPPPAEAAEILRLVSDAFAAAADTLAMLDAEAADAARLKQSILKAAFEGRLVAQDPADEPASALLARLAANPPAANARRGRVRKSDA